MHMFIAPITLLSNHYYMMPNIYSMDQILHNLLNLHDPLMISHIILTQNPITLLTHPQSMMLLYRIMDEMIYYSLHHDDQIMYALLVHVEINSLFPMDLLTSNSLGLNLSSSPPLITLFMPLNLIPSSIISPLNSISSLIYYLTHHLINLNLMIALPTHQIILLPHQNYYSISTLISPYSTPPSILLLMTFLPYISLF